MARPEITIDYLTNCSTHALDNVTLAQRNKAAEQKKIALEAIRRSIEAEALAELAQWIKIYGPQIIAMGIEKAG